MSSETALLSIKQPQTRYRDGSLTPLEVAEGNRLTAVLREDQDPGPLHGIHGIIEMMRDDPDPDWAMPDARCYRLTGGTRRNDNGNQDPRPCGYQSRVGECTPA